MVVVDSLLARVDKALAIGADAVINSGDEDVVAPLIELHGDAGAMFPGKSGTDVYLDGSEVERLNNER